MPYSEHEHTINLGFVIKSEKVVELFSLKKNIQNSPRGKHSFVSPTSDFESDTSAFSRAAVFAANATELNLRGIPPILPEPPYCSVKKKELPQKR